MDKAKKRVIITGFFISLISVVLIMLLTSLYFFEDFERKTLDFRFKYRSDKKKKNFIEDIVIVEIDDESASRLGRLGAWSRIFYADVLDYLSEGGAKQIAFDVTFNETGKEEEDRRLVESIKKSGRAYSSFYFSSKQGTDDQSIREFSLPFGNEIRNIAFSKDYMFVPLPEVSKNSKGIGYINLEADRDGIFRRVPLFINYKERAYPQLSVKMAIDYLGINTSEIKIEKGKFIHLGNIKIPVNEYNQMLVNYAGYKPFRYIAFWKVLKKQVPSEYFKDKIVFIGATAAGAFDLRATPLLNNQPGIEVNANTFYNIIKKNFVSELNIWQKVLLLLALSLICVVLSNFLSLVISIIAIIILWLLYFVATLYVFKENSLWLPVIQPSLVVFASFTGNLGYKFLTERKQKKFIHGAFQRYVSPAVIRELLANPEKISLYGEERELTILFSDIRGYTTFSENLSPRENVETLNKYFTRITNTVFKHEGTLDKFIGDAVMVVFGAPVYQENHAERACLCALEMLEEAKRFAGEQEKEGKHQFRIGIGINTGNMIIGNMGSEARMDYTVIGDNVNLGSRIESLNKDYKTSIIISESTYLKVKDKFEVKELGLVTVKGRKAETRIYELLGKK